MEVIIEPPTAHTQRPAVYIKTQEKAPQEATRANSKGNWVNRKDQAETNVRNSGNTMVKWQKASQIAMQAPKRGPAPRTLGAKNWHIRCKPPDTHPHGHKNSLHTPGPKPTGEGRGRATDSTSEPQSTQDVRDSNHERERGPKQEKPGNASKKTSKNNPKTGIREMKLEDPN